MNQAIAGFAAAVFAALHSANQEFFCGFEEPKMAYFLSVRMCLPAAQLPTEIRKPVDQLQPRCLDMAKVSSSRREAVLGCLVASVVSCSMTDWFLARKVAFAGEETKLGEEEEKDESLVGALKSLIDPNEKTKSGKVLPKAYLNSVKEVVKTLRESVNEDPTNNAKFRRTADAAKESIRGYISEWRGQKSVVNEESYVMLEKAIRTLASFYSKAGPSAPLPESIKAEVLSDLSVAEENL